MQWNRALCVVTLTTSALLVERSTASEPLDLIPAESLLCWHGRPFPDAAAPGEGQPTTWGALVDLGTRVAGGPLDSKGQLSIRVLQTFAQMIRYPHALALIDAQARPVGEDDEGRRGEKQQIVLVVQTRGKSEPFLRIIQNMVNEQVDTATATLEKKQAGRWSYQELRDRRMPKWFAIAWGEIDEHFVLTVGPGVWERVAAVAAGDAESMSREPWYARARSERGKQAQIEIFVNAKDVRERLDPFVDGRASAFFRAWNCADLDRAYWALGFEGRALFCLAHLEENGRTTRRLFADPQINDDYLLRTIPDGARYAIYRVPAGKLIPRFFKGIYAIRSSSVQADADRIWTEWQAKYDFDAERDLLPNLGQHIVFHNDPPHPLRLPLAMTTLIEIRGEPQKVRQTLERIFTALQAGLERDAETSPNPLRLLRGDDGVWHFQLAGAIDLPAFTVTDRFIVSSWSPTALRAYLEKIGSAAGERPR